MYSYSVKTVIVAVAGEMPLRVIKNLRKIFRIRGRTGSENRLYSRGTKFNYLFLPQQAEGLVNQLIGTELSL